MLFPKQACRRSYRLFEPDAGCRRVAKFDRYHTEIGHECGRGSVFFFLVAQDFEPQLVEAFGLFEVALSVVDSSEVVQKGDGFKFAFEAGLLQDAHASLELFPGFLQAIVGS